MKLDKYLDRIQDSPLMERAYSVAQRLGIIFEKFVFAILCGLFPKERGYRVFHVDWSNYTSSMGKGLDLRLFQRNKLLAVFEIKNWAKKGRPYGTETATEQILARFRNCGTNLKILVISFKSLLTKRALALLEANNVHVLETNKLVGKNDFQEAVILDEQGVQVKACYVLEECQNLIPNSALRSYSFQEISRFVTQGRNFGLSYIALTQRLASVDSNLVEISGLKYFGKTEGDNNRRKAKAWLPRESLNKARDLKTGDFLQQYGSKITLEQVPLFQRISKPQPYVEPQEPRKPSLMQRILRAVIGD